MVFESFAGDSNENKRLVLLVIVVVIAAIAYSFVYVDFGMMKSDISVNTRVDNFQSGEPETTTFDELYLYVEYNELGNILEDDLGSGPVSGEILPYANLKDDFDGPLLAVKVLKKDMAYTPFYSRGVYRVLYYYSSRGDTGYYDNFVQAEFGGKDPVVQFNSTQGPQVIERGIVIAKGEITGLYSWKAAKRKFMDSISVEMSNKLQDLKQG
jgi:hypothetical protein